MSSLIRSVSMNKNNSLPKGMEFSCSSCLVGQLCLAHKNVDKQAVLSLDRMVERKKSFQKSTIIYKAGDELKNLYAIRSGAVKIYSIDEHGDEQITGFHMPGELIGFDAIADNRHLSFAQTLETTSICEIPFEPLMNLAGRYPELNIRLLKLISAEISVKKNLTMMISKQTAEQRLATFILHLTDNLRRRNLSCDEIRLPMTRYEIGNYIALTVETISRLLSKLQQNQIISVKGRYITIIDYDRLKALIDNKSS